MLNRLIFLVVVQISILACSSQDDPTTTFDYRVVNNSSFTAHIRGCYDECASKAVSAGQTDEGSMTASYDEDTRDRYQMTIELIGYPHALQVARYHAPLKEGEKITLGYQTSTDQPLTRLKLELTKGVLITSDADLKISYAGDIKLVRPTGSEFWFAVFPTDEIKNETAPPFGSKVDGGETWVAFAKDYPTPGATSAVPDSGVTINGTSAYVTCTNAGCKEN